MQEIEHYLGATASRRGSLMRTRTAQECYIYCIYLSLILVLLLGPSTVLSLQLPRQQQHSSDDPESRCISCIRSVTSIGIDPNKRCEGGYYCGPFQFSYQYWAESGKPGNSQGIRDFEKCARDKECAEQTIRVYFKKFKRDCNNDGLVDCLDMAALHKAGPSGCSSEWFYKSRYWLTFNKTACATRREPANWSQMQKSELVHQQEYARPITMKNQTLTSECLDCICEGLSSCGTASTHNCGSGHVCGPFAISQAYWKEGKRPGASWTACSRTKECSSVTIRNYMEKYKRDCNGDGYVTCEDYAAIHRRGPMSCTNRDLLKEQYWTKFLTCRANQKPMNDANLVKVNEDSPEQLTSLTSRSNSIVSSAETSTFTTQALRAEVPHSTNYPIQSSTFSTSSTTPTTTTSSPTGPTNNQKASYQDAKEQVPPRLSSGLSNQNTIYELNPVVLETKATSNQLRNYQTAKPTQQIYEHPIHKAEVQLDQRETHEFLRNDHLAAVSNPAADSSKSHIDGTSAYPEPVQRPTVMDYNSLPTIIVSKRIETHSTSRISQPSGSISTDDNSHAPSVTSSMTTIAPAAATFAARDVITTTSPIADGLNPQQGANFSPSQSGSTQISDQNMDYPLSDFGAIGPSVDRASFDLVVNGIVANPDFSKSYPPIPEMIVQRKQPASSIPPRGPHRETLLTTKSTNDGQTSAAGAAKRENSKTLSPNIYNTVESDDSSKGDGDQSSLTSLVGPNSLNMTTLFDKGLNESSRIASECLDCICDASSNCDATVQCISKQREKNRCGLYMISWNQYKESDISLTALLSTPSPSSSQNDEVDEKLYYECATDKNCAEKLIHLYIEKYQKDCNLDGKIDCYDIAAIHRVGPESCNSNKFLTSQYWRDFNHCYTTDRLTTTIQPQLSSSQGG